MNSAATEMAPSTRNDLHEAPSAEDDPLEAAEAEAEIQHLATVIGANVQRFGLIPTLKGAARVTQYLGQQLAQLEAAGGSAQDMPAWSGLDDADFLKGAAVDLSAFIDDLESGGEYDGDDE